jgi:hypothetical protein
MVCRVHELPLWVMDSLADCYQLHHQHNKQTVSRDLSHRNGKILKTQQT